MYFQITIKGKLLKGLDKFIKDLYGRDTRHWSSDEYSIDIAQLSLSNLTRLKTTLTAYDGEGKTSVPSLMRDIGIYEGLAAANTSLEILQQKPKNLRQFIPMMTKLACLLKRQWLWCREDDSGADSGVWMPYLVTSVDYNHGGRDEKPYVEMTVKYVEHNHLKTEKAAWYWHELAGRTMQEILASEGFHPTNPVLETDYEFDMELYVDYVRTVGRQFMAKGWAFFDADDELCHRTGRGNSYKLAPGGIETRVVRDVDNETDQRPKRGSLFVEDIRLGEDDEDGIELDDEGSRVPVTPPVHPYIICHDMQRHRRVAIHARNLTPYVYNTGLADQLVLPEGHRQLINLLTRTDARGFSDVVTNKSGGVVIICQGLPGTGKTLTSEVISEQQQRPLYSVQCSQLGMDVDTIETNLQLVLKRASRWNAVTLLDEADVYLMARGHSLEHNAIVGVFLRVLEYAAGTLFLTTNRLDAIDDAIVSRSVAVLRYGIPPAEDRIKIWHNLLAANNVPDVSGAGLTELAAIPMSGRDIKNSLKLCLLMGKPVTCDNIQFLLQYRPATADEACAPQKPT